MQTVTCMAVPQAKVAGPAAKVAPAAKSMPKMLPKAGSFAAVLLSNAMAGMARAEELSLPEISLPDVTAASSDIATLFQDNPLLVGGGITLLLVPVGIIAISNLASGGAKVKYTAAARALEALGENSKVRWGGRVGPIAAARRREGAAALCRQMRQALHRGCLAGIVGTMGEWHVFVPPFPVLCHLLGLW
jgi:hypothetical protein